MATSLLQRLEDFFWRCSLGNRYSSAVEAKLANDVGKIDAILNGTQPRFEWSIDVSPAAITQHGWFSASRSFIKAILCLLAQQKPKSFKTNLDVHIDNAWLSKSNSKNYHHFFPKAFLNKKLTSSESWRINHIANITIVDDNLNKNDIRAKAPSVYIGSFIKENSVISETLTTHLINDIDGFGILTDDYIQFFDARIKVISDLLSKKIIHQDTDNQVQIEEEVVEEEEQNNYDEI